MPSGSRPTVGISACRPRSCAISASSGLSALEQSAQSERLNRNGVEFVAVLSCEAAPNPHSLAYLRTKKEEWVTR